MSQIEFINIELTSLCNAKCPQCARTPPASDRTLPLSSLTIEEIKSILPACFLKQISYVYSCGNVGDPILSPSLIPAFRYFRESGVPKLSLNTNGSLRGPSWWHELASILTGQGDHVVFSIDGLQDTNHLYRVNCDWEAIMASARSFISAGGKARWHFIVFEHNQHQVEEARELARKMGFASFHVKKTMRFESTEKRPLEPSPPTLIDYIHEDKLVKLPEILKAHTSPFQFYDSCRIDCEKKRQKEIFIDYAGNLWPCCYLASRMFGIGSEEHRAVERLFEQYGPQFLSLKHYSMGEIMQGNWFAQNLEQSWSQPTGNSANNRLPTCAASCAAGLNLQNILI